ncbi:MAG: glycoside hydrolase family 3 protein [Ignavibacteria bacterium]|nr:MAG: glycoside hydrolase family 3 protein [Ignavibacteria bacterium]KAF0160851.1 MAG: glycoside hydrolase family 3 protein [Ignavibacteria bacterium]
MSDQQTNEILEVTETLPYKNSTFPINERVKDLIGRMTLEEKIAQMLCIWGQKKILMLDDDGKLNIENLSVHLPNGIGQIARLSDTTGELTAIGMAELSNKIQKHFVEKTRLGIPVIFHEECLHGLAGKEATSYPQPIGLAATFNTELVEKIYSAVAEDTRSRGAHQALTPVVDVAREPRWGRVEETFGEDPYLVTQMGIASVKGFQGDASFTDKKRVIATLKHFAAHGQPESGTNCAPVNVSERLLRDTFLLPFKQVIEKSNALSVMASYNEIDGVSSHANKWLLRKILREEWGFKGFVVSDYYAVAELNIREEAVSHCMAKDKLEAAKLAVEAGVNIEFPDPDCYPYLVQLVQDGSVNEDLIDELVSSLLYYKFQLGLFEDPYVEPTDINIETRLEKERELALEAAHQVITLLKNENNFLPLDSKSKKTIAVIGPNADRLLIGGYSGEPKYFTSVLKGIKDKAGKDINILHSEGCKLTIGGSWNEDEITFPTHEENLKLIEQAIKTAEQADEVILVLGDNEQTSREAWNKTHMGDRANLDLFGMQNQLAEAIVELGKPVTVVLINGRPISINYLSTKAKAILECWYLGQELGNAVADVIFGNYNPGGKLPISFPRSGAHVPVYYNFKPSARRGYLIDDISPLYTFGFGLSYTTFEMKNVKLAKAVIEKGETTSVTVEIKNTGKLKGEEVVQMYIRDMFSSVTRPVKELKGFKRISLEAGETKTIMFPITYEHLAFTNIDMQYVVEAGDFEIMVGNSSRDEDLAKVILQVI